MNSTYTHLLIQLSVVFGLLNIGWWIASSYSFVFETFPLDLHVQGFHRFSLISGVLHQGVGP